MVAHNTLPVLELISDQMRAVLDKSAELAPDAYATDVGLGRDAAGLHRRASLLERGRPVHGRDDRHNGGLPGTARWPFAATCRASARICRRSSSSMAAGWVVGNLDTHDRIMRMLADSAGAAVVGVDYSLSPEAKFPVAIEQCADVARHLATSGSAYHVDGSGWRSPATPEALR